MAWSAVLGQSKGPPDLYIGHVFALNAEIVHDGATGAGVAF
jgi:hypothetical protein